MGNVYLEGTWSEVYPNITQDEAGMKKLFTQFSFPVGFRAMSRRQRRDPFMKAGGGSWDIR